MKNVKLILASFCLVLVGCSEDDDPAATAAAVTLTEGTYSASSVMLYAGACGTGTGLTGICTTDASVTDADSCEGMCMDTSTGGAIDAADEAACTAASGMWMGWMSLLDAFGEASVTFGANGVLTDPDGSTGTYTVDGSTVTMLSSYCEDENGNDVEAADEAACTAASGTWMSESLVGTINADGTITTDIVSDAYCDDGTNTTEADCDEDYWYDAECTSVVWTLGS